MAKPVTVKVTVEYTESRAEKVRGRAGMMRGRVVQGSEGRDVMSQEKVLRLKQKIKEKREELQDLDQMIDKFDMNSYRQRLLSKLQDALNHLASTAQDFTLSHSDYLAFLDDLLSRHTSSLSFNRGTPKDIFTLSLEAYQQHLSQLLHTDLHGLRRQLGELAGMKVGLLQDLEKHEQREALMLNGQDGDGEEEGGVREGRLRCLEVIREIEEARAWYAGGREKSVDRDAVVAQDQGRSYLQVRVQQDASTLAN